MRIKLFNDGTAEFRAADGSVTMHRYEINNGHDRTLYTIDVDGGIKEEISEVEHVSMQEPEPLTTENVMEQPDGSFAG